MTGPRPPEPNREILNIDEAAALLGVSTKTFAKVLRQGEMPGRKVGREWKFSRQALVDWVARGRSADFLDGDDVPAARAGGDGMASGSTQPRRASRPAPRRDGEMSIEED